MQSLTCRSLFTKLKKNSMPAKLFSRGHREPNNGQRLSICLSLLARQRKVIFRYYCYGQLEMGLFSGSKIKKTD